MTVQTVLLNLRNLVEPRKAGGKTSPWHGLINKFCLISKSYEALKSLLRQKGMKIW